MVGGFPCERTKLILHWSAVVDIGCQSCCLIVGIHALGISIPLSLLMLLGWSLMWIASLTLWEYQWGSRSINVTSSQSELCPILLACSETAEVWVRESRISLSCSIIRSCMYLPVSPIYTLPHSQGILYTTPSCFRGSTGSLGCTKCDLSVVSELKTDRTPCCCGQRRSFEVTIVRQTIKLNPSYSLSTMI